MIIAAIILIVAGILIKYGKMYFLIAGYNTMSKEKKANYDVGGIATLMRNVLFAMAFIMIVGYFIAIWLDNPTIEMYSFYTALLIGIPYLLLKSNSSKYKLDNDKTE